MAIATALTTASGIVSGATGFVSSVFGGGKESEADLNKQQIQQELENKGYNQFSKMSGWKGDEDAKLEAMKILHAAVLGNPDRVAEITSFLEGGKITPGTIEKIESRFPTNTRQFRPEPTPVGPMDPMAATAQRNGRAGMGISGVGSVPVWVWVGGAVLVGGIAYLATQGRP